MGKQEANAGIWRSVCLSLVSQLTRATFTAALTSWMAVPSFLPLSRL